MFFHRLTLRRWAARMLATWLFGMGVGIANGCVAADLAHPRGSLTSHAVDADAARHHSPTADADAFVGPSGVQAQADTQDEPNCHPRTTCADYCDKTSVAMAQLKSKTEEAHDHAMPTAVTDVVVAVHRFEPLPLRAPRRDGVRTVPIPIALLRLAL